MEKEITVLGLQFAELIARNTVSFVTDRVKLAQSKKDIESQSVAFSEIINDLLQDKNDLTLLAREYKQAFEQITISDSDIEYLHNTLRSAIDVFNTFSPQTEATQATLNTLIELLNKDTLKTMQLLGFNYKEAIGIPLTEVCANAIRGSLQTNKGKISSKGK